MSSRKYNIKGSRNQDLIAARAELKQFRHDVALLKKKGLITKKYDARSISPTKYLKSKIKQFASVISGESTAVKINKKNIGHYKQRGFTTANGKVIIPHAPNEKIYSSHSKVVKVTKTPSGKITEIDLQYYGYDLTEWKERVKKIRLREGERLGFSFYGNRMSFSPADVDFILLRLEYYPTFMELEQEGNPDKTQELIDNIILYRVERGAILPRNEPPSDEIIEERKRKRQRRRNAWLARMPEDQYNKYLDAHAAYEKKRRANLKNKSMPEEIEAQKEKARLRAKKSYQKRKGK